MYCKLQAWALLALHVYGRQTSIQAQQQCVSQYSLFYTRQLLSISMLALEIHPHFQLPFTTPLSTLPAQLPFTIPLGALPQKYTHMPNFCLLIPLVYAQLLFTNPPSTLPQKYTHTPNFYSLFLLVHCLRNTPTCPTSVY